MFLVLGSTLSIVLIVAAIRHEIRSAACGITLSNGVEVLVSPEMYGEILRRYESSNVEDERDRWDQAVLNVLRPVRPNEWKYLVRSLGYQLSGERHAARKRRQTVDRYQ